MPQVPFFQEALALPQGRLIFHRNLRFKAVRCGLGVAVNGGTGIGVLEVVTYI